VNPDDAVVVTVAADEVEAEMFCGLLRSNSVECAYRETEAIDSPLETFTGSGPREILVHERDLDKARSLLPG